MSLSALSIRWMRSVAHTILTLAHLIPDIGTRYWVAWGLMWLCFPHFMYSRWRLSPIRLRARDSVSLLSSLFS